MTAHFYLMAESFAKNEQFTDEIIEDKVKRLSEDVTLIHKYRDTNVLYANYTELYPQVLYQTYTIEDFICTPHLLKQHGVDRDIVNSIQKILINLSEETQITSDEVISELLNWNNENDCHGIIAFYPIEGLEENLQVIYGIDGWYKFRRYFLSIYPDNEIFFIDECVKYFPNLYFHDRNKTTVGAILKSSSKKIVHHLSELNDKYHTCTTQPYSRIDTLKRFNATCVLDQNASVEGNIDRKAILSWSFRNDSNTYEEVYCELHLKLLLDDKGKISTDRRIYFHEGKNSIQNGKILIGHIGDHL